MEIFPIFPISYKSALLSNAERVSLRLRMNDIQSDQLVGGVYSTLRTRFLNHKNIHKQRTNKKTSYLAKSNSSLLCALKSCRLKHQGCVGERVANIKNNQAAYCVCGN